MRMSLAMNLYMGSFPSSALGQALWVLRVSLCTGRCCEEEEKAKRRREEKSWSRAQCSVEMVETAEAGHSVTG